MARWRQALISALLVAPALAGCSALKGPPDNWDSQADCEAANPGHRCSYSTCDVNCGLNQDWSGWVPGSASVGQK